MNIIRKWIHMEGIPRVVQRILFGLCGLIVICMAKTLRDQVHYVVSGVMLLISVVMMINGIREKAYNIKEDSRIPTAIVGMVLSIMIAIRQHGAIPFIAIAWGINGLGGGTAELGHALYAMLHHESFRRKLIHGLLETVLALALVFDPYEKIGEHIVILGVEMIVQAAAGDKEKAPKLYEKSGDSTAERNS